MKALTLLATLKKDGQSNTHVLSDFLNERLAKQGVETETIKLVDHDILPGTYSDMGEGDAWPAILEKILAADILIWATPVWWGGHSSEMQKVIERLDELHDEILAGNTSRVDGKVSGIIITGDSDGAEQIIGVISNFCNALGILIPPYATLSSLSQLQAKDKTTSREKLMELYEKEQAKYADQMVAQLVKYAS